MLRIAMKLTAITAYIAAINFQRRRHPHSHPYPQLHGAFLSHLSALDLLMNCGPRSREYLPGELDPVFLDTGLGDNT
jgi:hypothetical protein